MKSLKGKMHTFIVRIWLEPREIEGKNPEWRGVVEHVGDDKRHSFRDLRDVEEFIASFTQEMRFTFSRMKRALKRLTLKGLGLGKRKRARDEVRDGEL